VLKTVCSHKRCAVDMRASRGPEDARAWCLNASYFRRGWLGAIVRMHECMRESYLFYLVCMCIPCSNRRA